MRVALILWSGRIGGTESATADLAWALRSQGLEARILFIEGPHGLDQKLRRLEVPYSSLNLVRGRAVLGRPNAVARAVSEIADAVIVPECGFLGAALRIGGFRGRLIAVEHGALLETRRQPRLRRLADTVSRVVGAWADDIEVAVSDFMLAELRSAPHASVSVRISNGIAISDHCQEQKEIRRPINGDLIIGAAGRFIPGKGFDLLLRAVARVRIEQKLRVLLAGDGSQRPLLEELARDLGLADRVTFLGPLSELTHFWRQCDIAVIPSGIYTESFSMVTLEAMSFGRAIVATRNGGIPELIEDGSSGILVPRGNIQLLAEAIASYARQPELRIEHGLAARQRCVENFEIGRVAHSYTELLYGANGRGSIRRSDGRASTAAAQEIPS
jgi:glycosyltransferase involved in cell wall biosynthesis